MIKKLLSWAKLNLVSILGILQGIVKVIKEVATAIVNILFPLIPSTKFQKVVLLVRSIANKVDDILEKIKSFFLKAVN